MDTIEFYQQKLAELREQVNKSVLALENGAPLDGEILDGQGASLKASGYYTSMGDLFLAQGDKDHAARSYEAALQLNPCQLHARLSLLKTRPFVSEDDRNKAFLEGMLAMQPDNTSFLVQLGRLHRKRRETGSALELFRRAAEIDPANADVLYALAETLQDAGDCAGAEDAYLRAVKIKPIVHVPATSGRAGFSVLSLFAPFAGNTPADYLMTAVPYDINICALLEALPPDPALLEGRGDVMINLISEADQGRKILPLVEKLVSEITMPVVNDPVKIRRTTREGIAALLQDLPGVKSARVLRIAAKEDMPVEKIPFAFPLLVRPTGTHGGDRFEKLDDINALHAFLQKNSDVDCYLSEYIDYQSADGHFRKYRFIFVNGKIMPYHLAISEHWKVHHASAKMAGNQVLQREEEAFLSNPRAIFSMANHAALEAVRHAVGLDFFGIDCALDRDGNLVVFEVNATMFVHGDNEQFPYKTPYVAAIKQEFGRMLERMATKH